jgi:hypothetical protein
MSPLFGDSVHTPFEAVGIFQSEHEGERGKRSNSLNLAQEFGLWVALFSDGFQLSIVVADTLCQRAYLIQDGSEGRPQRLWYVLRPSVVEAPRRALGQAMTEGFDRSSNVMRQPTNASRERMMAMRA